MTKLAILFARDQESSHRQILEAYDSLSVTGSLFLICDFETAYALQPFAQKLFGGSSHLRNEIIWTVRSALSGRETHSTILWFVKDPRLAPFNALTMPKSRETIRRFGEGRIRSAMNPHTKRRAPARIDGESLSAPLNDVWIWDERKSAWLTDLEEIDGEDSVCSLHAAVKSEGRSTQEMLSRLAALVNPLCLRA